MESYSAPVATPVRFNERQRDYKWHVSRDDDDGVLCRSVGEFEMEDIL